MPRLAPPKEAAEEREREQRESERALEELRASAKPIVKNVKAEVDAALKIAAETPIEPVHGQRSACVPAGQVGGRRDAKPRGADQQSGPSNERSARGVSVGATAHPPVVQPAAGHVPTAG